MPDGSREDLLVLTPIWINANPPQPLMLSGNFRENWRRWEQRFQIYMAASGAESKPEKAKTAILLHALGEEAIEPDGTQ